MPDTMFAAYDTMKENGLTNYFRQMFRLLRECEDKKVDLAMRHDFSSQDLFRVADYCKRGKLNRDDFL